jgi:hypothetical protein
LVRFKAESLCSIGRESFAETGPELDSEFCVLRFLPATTPPTSADAAIGTMYSGAKVLTSAGNMGVFNFKADDVVSNLELSREAGSLRTI